MKHPREREANRQRAEARQRANSVEHVAQEFIDRYASKKRTGIAIGQLIKREVVARWAKRPITDIARRDVITMVEEIGEPATAFLLELIARLQGLATVSMIDVRAYAAWLR